MKRRFPSLGRCLALVACALLIAGCATAPRGPGGPGQPAAVRVQGISGPVSIVIDRHGIPDISAGSEADVAFGLGYMHGRDRRFQMELLRMDALGRLREFLGARVPRAVLRLEIFSRALAFERDARALLATLSPEDRRILDAYASGVNAATDGEPRPFEFRLMGYYPEPWTAVDTLAVMQLVSFGFCKNWEQELVRLEIIVFQLGRGFSMQHALAVWPPRFDMPPHLIGQKPIEDPFASIPLIAPELAEYLETSFAGESLSEVRGAEEEAPDALATDLDLSFLSNNWAVDGKWTRTGRSAFAMDPHMPSSLPPLPYLIRLTLDSAAEGSYRVTGASFPCLPAVPFGTNGAVAWGPTSNWADVTDLYVEKPSVGKPGYYQTETGDRPFTVREEVYRVRHGTRFTEEKRSVRETRHGVIVNDFVDRLPPDFPLVALSRAPTFGDSLRSLRGLYRASTVAEARAALSGFTAMVGHWVLADAKGDIGYASPVNLPLRRASLGTVPVPGWNGKYEWDGFVPADKLPGLENPAAGYVATANNQVVQPESPGYPINFEGDVPFRVVRIDSKLAQGTSGDDLIAQMSKLQTDGRDNSWDAVRGIVSGGIARLADSPSTLVASAARTLLAWDGNVDPDSPAPTLYQSLLTTLMNVLLSREMSTVTLSFLRFYFNADPLLFGMLQDPDNPAWKDLAELSGEDRDAVVAMSFRLSIAALVQKYGARLDNWTWRRTAPVIVAHPLGSIPGFGFLNRGGFAPRGTASSIWLHKYDRDDPARFPVLYGPGVRLVVDFSDPARCLLSIPGGQSGRPGNRHYADILPLFEKGEGVLVDLSAVLSAQSTESRMRFVPAGSEQGQRRMPAPGVPPRGGPPGR